MNADDLLRYSELYSQFDSYIALFDIHIDVWQISTVPMGLFCLCLSGFPNMMDKVWQLPFSSKALQSHLRTAQLKSNAKNYILFYCRIIPCRIKKKRSNLGTFGIFELLGGATSMNNGGKKKKSLVVQDSYHNIASTFFSLGKETQPI